MEIGEFRTALDAVPTDADAEDEGTSTSLASITMSSNNPASWKIFQIRK